MSSRLPHPRGKLYLPLMILSLGLGTAFAVRRTASAQGIELKLEKALKAQTAPPLHIHDTAIAAEVKKLQDKETLLFEIEAGIASVLGQTADPSRRPTRPRVSAGKPKSSTAGCTPSSSGCRTWWQLGRSSWANS